MKKIMSFLILLAVLFLGLEFIVTIFTKEYTVNYTIRKDKQEIKIKENYQEKGDNTYTLEINIKDNTFYYLINNNFNKQKQIVKDIIYYEDNGDMCIYPILKDDSGSYIECSKDKNLYVSSTFSNQNLVNTLSKDLDNRGYKLDYNDDFMDTYGISTIYRNNINDLDTIILWQYKNIDIISNKSSRGASVLDFDKYDNKLGTLIGKYYIVPKYTNEKILEFNKVVLVNIETGKVETVESKDYTLSSSTYINGIVNNKLYYTDASNLIQIEFNPSNKKFRLIGNVDIGGQMYNNGKWENRNIYDFKQEIKYNTSSGLLDKEGYASVIEGKAVYYVKDNNGNIYQIFKNNLDKKVLIFKNVNSNNLNVVGNDLYCVIGDTLYYYSNSKGTLKILTSKDLLYNTNNRISIYRKNS